LTLLEIVNKVMRKLREEQVSDFSVEYSAMVASFVADAHKIVVDYHDWSSMNKEILFSIDSTQASYSLYTGAPEIYVGSPAPTQESTLLMADNEHPLSYLYVSHAEYSTGTPLHQLVLADPRYLYRMLSERNNYLSRPAAFSYSPDSQNNGVIVTFDTVPDSTYFVAMKMFTPEAELDTSNPALVIEAPWYPVYCGALMFALNERGEELGEPGNVAETRFNAALDRAKETDLLQQARPNRFEMYRD
jgi:hypothetical protein